MTIVLIAVAAAALLLLAVAPDRGAEVRMDPFASWKYAHRGLYDNASAAPENSLPAFRRAVEAGYGVELDLHLTTDGRLAVFHDDDLARVCGVDAPVVGHTLAELQAYRLLGTQERMPSFEEVLKILDGRVPMILELKYQKDYDALCRRTMEALENYGGMVCVESFHPSIVRWFRKNRPEVARGILSMDYFADREKEAKVVPLFFAKNLFANFLIRPDFVAFSEAQGSFGFWLWRRIWQAPCVGWTVQSPEREKEARRRFQIVIFEGYLPEKD